MKSLHIGDLFHRVPLHIDLEELGLIVPEWADENLNYEVCRIRPDARKAFGILENCRNLTRLFVDLKVGEHLCLLAELWSFRSYSSGSGKLRPEIYFKDDFHWTVKWGSGKNREAFTNQVLDRCSSSPDWAVENCGKLYRIQVDMAR